jgi:hypothetical protein
MADDVNEAGAMGHRNISLMKVEGVCAACEVNCTQCCKGRKYRFMLTSFSHTPGSASMESTTSMVSGKRKQENNNC